MVMFVGSRDRPDTWRGLALCEKWAPTLVLTNLSPDDWAAGLLAAMADVTEDQVRSGRLDPPEWRRLREAEKFLREAPLFVATLPEDEESIGWEICAHKDRMAAKGLDLSVVFTEPYGLAP